MATVSLQNLRKDYGGALAVSDFSLDIAEGEMVAFLGPSGCGKTTTLRMIAGFVAPSAGAIRIGDTDVTGLPPERRDTGMVFQRYALFPHMTVAQNVAFGLEMRRMSARDRKQRATEALDMVRMSPLAERYPRQLSGGQQQRVAIARALAIRPKVFLLDEPLSNLDAKLRVEVREEIRALQQRLGLTTIFVTHDQEEALTVSDRLAIMHDGRVQQVGRADELYERPANRFVADFLGRMNFYEGHLGADGFETGKGTLMRVADVAAHPPGHAVTVGIRPERIVLSRLQPVPLRTNVLPVTVTSQVYMGSVIEWRLRTAHGDLLACHTHNASHDPARGLAPGDRAFACFDAHDCVSFH
ncbi:ABC transporter ATP-binding protein [Robbsia sp. Bb-Pol-6]|uniref:ABC transporter ATP-binding protein n=1 Tax=Robbsia betulipollinis TaxID=2981849 RepID=A0ABT3ZNS8_9BURK|nr:ABC transporter ATP-binding protein [Robbsia betulipollinis]MCY0388199.1 ABC transporter ATP-binding protein [Robbsia betulipollinis]